MFKIHWISRFNLVLITMSTVSSDSQRQYFKNIPQNAKKSRREVIHICADTEFYDAVVHHCILCSDVCKLLQMNHDYCARNCPEYYRENIFNTQLNISTSHISAQDNNQPKGGNLLQHDLVPEIRADSHVQVIPVLQNTQHQYRIERLIDKPLFWTSVISLFVAVMASIFMVVLCIWRRRQCRQQGRRRFGRMFRSSSSSSDCSVDDDNSSSKKGSSSDDSLLNSDQHSVKDSTSSMHTPVMQQQQQQHIVPGGFTGSPGVCTYADNKPHNEIIGETCEVEVDMPSTSTIELRVNTPQLENQHHSIYSVPVHNANIIEIYCEDSLTSSMRSSLSSSLSSSSPVSVEKKTSLKSDVRNMHPSVKSEETALMKAKDASDDVSMSLNVDYIFNPEIIIVTSTTLKQVEHADEIKLLSQQTKRQCNQINIENSWLKYEVRQVS